MATSATYPIATETAKSAPSGLVVAGERDSDLLACESEMVAFFVDAVELLGVPKSVAAIYGIIFASTKPLSFSEIENRLTISKGSVSQGLKALRDVGAVKESVGSDEGSRPVQRYEPDMELRKLIKHFLETRIQSQLEGGSSRLKKIEESVAKVPEDVRGILQNRTKYLAGWHKKARALLPLIRSALILVPKK